LHLSLLALGVHTPQCCFQPLLPPHTKPIDSSAHCACLLLLPGLFLLLCLVSRTPAAGAAGAKGDQGFQGERLVAEHQWKW